MKIPDHLSHLRTDRRGLPVPFVNRWGGEDVSRLRIAPDRHAGGRPAVFLDDADEPVPDFTAQNMGRQRQSMAAGLCQVCARHVPWSRRFLAIAGLSVERITVNGRTCAAVTEPWLCERCATFATNHCPALIRRRRDEELTLYPITSQRQVQLVASAGWIEGPLEAESRRIQPAMWVKAIVTGIHLAPTTWGQP